MASQDFLSRYKDLLSDLRASKAGSKLTAAERQKTARQQARAGIKQDKAAAREAGIVYQSPSAKAASISAIPQSYLDKYGSEAGRMYAQEQVKQKDLAKTYSAQGVTPQDIEKYGSSALDIVRARNLDTNRISAAKEALTAGSPEQRNQALEESYRLAQSAGIPGAKSSKEATREFYTKEFAKFGNNPNVFGMKDLLEMRNRGESEGDIRRMALTIGSVGPLAQKELGLGYMNRQF